MEKRQQRRKAHPKVSQVITFGPSSEVFTVITETREAAAVKLISVVVKRFTDVCLFIRVQLVEFLQKR